MDWFLICLNLFINIIHTMLFIIFTVSTNYLAQVDGVDLRDATHEEAVDVIRNANSPVKFVVRGLTTRSFLDGQNLLHSTKSDSDGSNSLQVSQKSKGFSIRFHGGKARDEKQ